MAQIIEGTWDEIKSHESELVGHKLRLIVDPIDPPTTIRDQDHLIELLLEGVRSGPATPMAQSDWDDIRREVHSRAVQRNGLHSA